MFLFPPFFCTFSSVDDILACCEEKKRFTILALPGVTTDCEGGADVGAEAAGEEEETQAEAEQGGVWKLKQGQQSPPWRRIRIMI